MFPRDTTLNKLESTFSGSGVRQGTPKTKEKL